MIFVTYRHENEQHSQCVATFCNELKKRGLNVILDQFFMDDNPGGPNEGWHKWCPQQVEKADRVLIIGSQGWFEAFETSIPPTAGLGAASEAHIIRTSLYQTGQINDKFRIVRIQTSGSYETPTSLATYHQFDGNKPSDFSRLVKWLDKEAPLNSHEQEWPIIPSSSTWPFADRLDVRDAFFSLLTKDSSDRVLFITGESESGKSRITKHLLAVGLTHPNIACGRLDLKGGTGLDNELMNFSQHLVAPGTSLEPLLGNGNTIDKLRRLIAHVSERKVPTLIIVDTYDESQSREFSEWLQKSLLVATIRNSLFRVIIAGQRIPDSLTEPWSNHTKIIRIQPPTYEDWVELNKLYKRINVNVEEYIRTTYEVTDGKASILWQILGPKLI